MDSLSFWHSLAEYTTEDCLARQFSNLSNSAEAGFHFHFRGFLAHLKYKLKTIQISQQNTSNSQKDVIQFIKNKSTIKLHTRTK